MKNEGAFHRACVLTGELALKEVRDAFSKMCVSFKRGDWFRFNGDEYKVVDEDLSQDIYLARLHGDVNKELRQFSGIELWQYAIRIDKSPKSSSGKCECGSDVTYGVSQAEYLHAPYCPKHKRP